MTKLTETQTIVLGRAATRSGNLAMPLPDGLHGAAAKKSVAAMISRGWLEEVDADLRKGEPLWRETGDGHGTTLVATEAGLEAIGIEPVVAKAVVAIREHAAKTAAPKQPKPRAGTKQAKPRAGTKQAMLIEMLEAPEGAAMKEIVAATGWQSHSARGFMSGALRKKLGLVVTSAKEDDRGRVYRINRAD